MQEATFSGRRSSSGLRAVLPVEPAPQLKGIAERYHTLKLSLEMKIGDPQPLAEVEGMRLLPVCP